MANRTFRLNSIKQRRRLVLLIVCQLVWVGGCAPAPERMLDDYQQRLSRVLAFPQLQHAATDDEQPKPLPQVRDLYQTLPDMRLDLLDLIAIRDCGLQSLVAQRNSSLGKVMSSANQLGYELELLQQLQPCLTHPSLDFKLRQQLQDYAQQKRLALPKALNNLLLTDQTLRQQLQGSQRSLNLGAANTTADTVFALQQLIAIKQQILALSAKPLSVDTAKTNAIEPPTNNEQSITTAGINQALGLLYQGQLLADLQHSMLKSNQQLRQLNQKLAAVDLALWCVKAQKNGQLEILTNVFSQIYIGRVQPYLAQLDSINYQLVPLLTQLYADSPLQPLVVNRFSQPADALRQHLSVHVHWWQQVQQQCQLRLAPSSDAKHA